MYVPRTRCPAVFIFVVAVDIGKIPAIVALISRKICFNCVKELLNSSFYLLYTSRVL